MSLVNEEQIKNWLQEEQEKKSYSLKSLQQIMQETLRRISSLIVPIQKQELNERLSAFDDINLWISICNAYEEKIALKIQDERNKLLDSWGMSIQTFERSFDEHSANLELTKSLEDLKYELISESGEMATEISLEQYKTFLNDELYYLKNYESELDTLKKSPKPLRRWLIDARTADYAARKNGINVSDVLRFVKTNLSKQEDIFVELLREELSKCMAEHCEPSKIDPLKKVIAIAKEQQITQGIISADIVDSILEYIFESVNEKLLSATEQERKERRANFGSIAVWVQTIQKYVKMAIDLSDTELEKALQKTCDDLSGDIWEKSLTLYDIDVTQRLDEFSLKKKMESTEQPKNVTKELYLQFLDVQLDYLKNHVSELEELGIRSLYLSERIRDYCAIKTGFEAEDIMIFAEDNQDVLYEPDVMQKLFEIDNRMKQASELLDSKAKSSVDSENEDDLSDNEY